MSDDAASLSPKPRCLRSAAWPALDRQLWLAAQQAGGLLDEPGGAARWRPETRKAVASSYGRWIHWLTVNDALDPCAAPAERVTLDHVKAYVAELQASNASNTVHMRILQLGRMLEVMAPGSRPEWFPRVLRKLHAARQPARDDRTRLLPASTLLRLGKALIERAEQQTEWSLRRRALHYRDGLLILFLCACPLREGSLAIIQIGRHFERRGDCWWVVLGSADTKNRRPLDLPLPAAFTEAVDRYLSCWRPVLLDRQKPSGATNLVNPSELWLSEAGGKLRPKDFHGILTRVTRRELGRAVNPHLFRKMATTELAIHDPAHVGIAQPLLGHASYQTTEQAYNLARALDAARLVHGTLGSIRREGKEVNSGSRKTP